MAGYTSNSSAKEVKMHDHRRCDPFHYIEPAPVASNDGNRPMQVVAKS